ncbi:MAG: lysine--tRNA ligase [Acidimicrobiia bacterium]
MPDDDETPSTAPGAEDEANANATSEPGPRADDEPDEHGAPGEEEEAGFTSAFVAEQRRLRLEKLDELRAAGVEPYPVRFDRTHTAGQIQAAHPDLEPGTETDEHVSVAGRVMLLRRQGKLSFATLQDRDGDIQLFVSTDSVGEAVHHDFDHLDRGDWVGIEGTVMTTRRGELSIKVAGFQLLSKVVRPLPEKWHGLTDTDARYRQRYLDLVMNDEARRIAMVRIQTISRIRRYLEDHGFVEVEGPTLQSIQGGATARPFVTHHNALDIDLYLRIALELHLKRLIVGGLDRVFEIGRVYRNEGIDTVHNPEFTMLEAYQAFGDYHDMMDLTEGIIVDAATPVLPDLKVTYGDVEIDFTPPFKRATMVELIKDIVGVDIHPAMPVADARAVLDGLGIEYEPTWGSGKLTNAIYDEVVQYKIVQPTFVLDHPREVSPLARAHRDDPTLTERFELVIAGHELANAYSELNDPVDQLARFEDEAKAKAEGDAEAGDVDLDYVRALEYGLPPTGGLGIGIDRLVMYITGTPSIREVILFPTLRPEPGMGGLTHADGEAGTGAATTGEPPEMEATVRALASAPPPPARPSRGPLRAISWMVALGGILAIASLVPWMSREAEPLRDDILPLWSRVTGQVTVVLLGLVLLFTAGQLAKGKRRAWELATVVTGGAFILHVLKGPHPFAAAYTGILFVLLVTYRERFRAPSDPPSALRLLRAIPLYLVIVYGFGTLALVVERDHLSPTLTVGGALETVTLGLVGISGPYEYERHFFSEFYPAALLALGIFGLVALLVLLFRPLTARAPHREADWDEAERIVRTYGWDTLAAFALRDDKSFFFSSDGEAMIGYTYMASHGLAAGDPIGRPESIPLVVDEFLEFCRGRGWSPGFLAVRESDLALYSSRGLRHIYLGDEAIIHCRHFDLDTPATRDVRQAVRRVERTHSFRILAESTAPPDMVSALNAISERWRGDEPERGFTMDLAQDVNGANPEFLLCVALDADQHPTGFLRLVPAYGVDRGYTLDLMRHDPAAPNGITEFRIAHAALALRERGVDRLSMNFAAWGRLLDPDVQHTPTQRLTAWGIRKLNPFFQIESLRTFNEKFSPEWLPRSIVYTDAADLPRLGLLYAGIEGFLAVPVLRNLFVPKPVGGIAAPESGLTGAPSASVA